MPHKIGITGGIGSGKTTVCMIFETLGVPVYYADVQAKKLMHTKPSVKAAIKELFGVEIYHNDKLDVKKLAEIVFNNKIALKNLNGIVHPAVQHDFDDWCARQTCHYILEEAAIIYESKIEHRFQKIILVTAPDAVRIQRVCKRDNVSPQTVRERMKNQYPEEKKIAMADYVIVNDDIQMLIPQIVSIHKQICQV